MGKPVVTLSPASVEAGYKAMTTTRDGFHVGGGSGDPTAWPLTKVDHALVPAPSTSTDPTHLASIARLLRYAAGPGQQRLPDGFVPMPAGLAAETTQVADVLAPPPTTTTTTPASAAPISVVDPGSFAGAPTEPAPASAAPGSAPPPGATSAAVAVKAAENAERRRTEPVFAVSSSGPERFALPIVLLVGLLAFAFGAADLTRRKLAGARQVSARAGAVLDAGRGRGATRASPSSPIAAFRRPRRPIGWGSSPPVARRGVYTLGIAIAVFVAFALWFSGLAHARAQVGLDRRFRAELAGASAPIGGRIAPGAPVAIVRIPRIGVDEVVVEGSTSGELRKGPGHVVGSSLPGQPGNAAIAGRRTFYGGPFRRLGSLRPGDEVAVTTGQGRATYRVASVAKVRAGDGSIFVDHGDNRLTLFTADSRVGASRRLVVTATLTGDAFAATALRRTLDPEGLGLTGERGGDRDGVGVARAPARGGVARRVCAHAVVTHHDVGRVRAGDRAPHVDRLRERSTPASRHALTSGGAPRSRIEFKSPSSGPRSTFMSL